MSATGNSFWSYIFRRKGRTPCKSLNGRPAFSGVPLRRELDSPFYPHVPSISLECTNLCNLKCPYCANQALTRRRGTIRWELLEKLVEECCREGYRLDTLHGTGEPLLYNRLEDAVRLIRSRNARNGM